MKEQLTSEGFNEVFEKNLKDSDTYTEAYRKTERFHYDRYGRERYSSYDSFRRCRRNLLRKGKKFHN